MAINKKLIHFLKKENFENEVANGNILDNSIVFIKDTKEIWTHGTYYGSDNAPFIKGVGADSAVSNSNYGCEATGANSFANGIYAKATGVASTALGRYCLASGRGAFAGGGLVYTLYLTGSGTKYTLSTSTTTNSAPPYWLLHPDKTLVGNEFITAVTNGTNLHVANITEAVVENDIITVTVDKVISTSNISNAKYYLLGCLATGTSSHAEGLSFKATGTSAHVEGSHTIATGFAAHAEGNQTFANENSAHSEGYQSIALGMISHAEGNITQALAEASHAEGNQTKALGQASHAEGLKTSALNITSHAEGNYTIASGQVSHAEGSRTQALGNKSHAEGNYTNAIGHTSHAEGSFTNAVGDMSHVEGGSLFNIYFSGDGSNNTYQIKNGSNWQYVEDLEKLVNAEILEVDNFEVVATIKSYVLGDDGYTITVTLDNSLGVLDPYVLYGVRLGIAEGEFSHSQNAATKSVGEASTSMGLFTVAQADSSLSTGCRTVARGENSATFGEHTFTTNNGEFALGISNISHTGETEESQTLLSVGIGSESPELDMATRIKNQIPFTSMQDGKNALEIMRNGDIWFGEYNTGLKVYDGATNTTPFIEKKVGETSKVVLGDGTLKSLSEIGGKTYSVATPDSDGLMSKEDKIKSDLFEYSIEENSLDCNAKINPIGVEVNNSSETLESKLQLTKSEFTGTEDLCLDITSTNTISELPAPIVGRIAVSPGTIGSARYFSFDDGENKEEVYSQLFIDNALSPVGEGGGGVYSKITNEVGYESTIENHTTCVDINLDHYSSSLSIFHELENHNTGEYSKKEFLVDTTHDDAGIRLWNHKENTSSGIQFSVDNFLVPEIQLVKDGQTEVLINSTGITAPKFITKDGTADQVVLGDGTLKNLSDFNTFDPSILDSKQDKIEDILTLSADSNTSNNIINVKTTMDDASASNIEILYNDLSDVSTVQQQTNISSVGINSSWLMNYDNSLAKANISKNFGIFAQDASNNMKLSLNYEDETDLIAYDIKQSHYSNAEILVSNNSCYTHFVGNLDDGIPSEATLGITSGLVSILELKRYSLHIKACVNAGNPYIEIYSRGDGTTTITPTDITSPKFIKTNGTATQILMADGSVKEISEVGKSYSTATESEDGLMSAADKQALEELKQQMSNINLILESIIGNGVNDTLESIINS